MIFLQEVWEKPNLKTVLAMSVMTAAEVTAQTGSEWLVLPLFFFFFFTGPWSVFSSNA